MADVTVSTIQFKRGTKAVLEQVLVDDKRPVAGEPIYESDTNKLKIGDGTHDYADLSYISGGESGDCNLLVGYYLNNEFYTDSTYTTKLVHTNIKPYFDCNSQNFYKYIGDTTGFKTVVATADEVTPGLVKLYKTNGQNEDGTMTQKAITDGVASIKFAVESVDTNGNGVVDDGDENCLVLDLPWTV